MPKNALNSREKRFCRHYVAVGVGATAAIEAGYSKNGAKEAAFRLLKRPNVQLEIGRLRELAHYTVNQLLSRAAGAGPEGHKTTKEMRKQVEAEVKAILSRAYLDMALMEVVEIALGRRQCFLTTKVRFKDPATGKMTTKEVTAKGYKVDLSAAVSTIAVLHRELDRRDAEEGAREEDDEASARRQEEYEEALAKAMARSRERAERLEAEWKRRGH